MSPYMIWIWNVVYIYIRIYTYITYKPYIWPCSAFIACSTDDTNPCCMKSKGLWWWKGASEKSWDLVFNVGFCIMMLSKLITVDSISIYEIWYTYVIYILYTIYILYYIYYVAYDIYIVYLIYIIYCIYIYYTYINIHICMIEYSSCGWM